LEFQNTDALIVVDVQNDFCAGGTLAVTDSEHIFPHINELIFEASKAGAVVVASRDWHPPNHISFIEQGGDWPRHCIQGTIGAEIHRDLKISSTAKIFSKGTSPISDQYSAFANPELIDWLKINGTSRVYIVGLAFDYCVKETALDAARLGFQSCIIEKGTKPVSNLSITNTISDLSNAGVEIINV
jgi:nicotinamidase/pyrazinamidase